MQEWSLLDDFVSLQSCQDIIAWACAGDPNLMEGEACVIAWFLGWCILDGCWHGSYLSSVLPLQFSIFHSLGPLRDPWSSVCGYMVRHIMYKYRGTKGDNGEGTIFGVRETGSGVNGTLLLTR